MDSINQPSLETKIERRKEYMRRYGELNPEKAKEAQRKFYELNPGKNKEYQKKYREANKEKCAARSRISILKKREAYLEKGKKWKKENAEHNREYQRINTSARYHSDPEFKILHNLRVRVRQALRKSKKSRTTGELCGCSLSDLKIYLESKFKPGMNWENYSRKGWHIDHIRPCASFDLTKEDQQKLCFHYTNLQPLWAADNLKKSDKWEPIQTTQTENTQNLALAV